jgi:DNA repair protein RadA/Sms
MAKIKTAFFCQQCGHESAKWLGKCPSCNTWNSFVEELKETEKQATATNWTSYNTDDNNNKTTKNKVVLLHEVPNETTQRIICNDGELNRVLGGGIVLGSIVLVAGEPGIGKSTLFLQIGLQLNNKKVLYISGEESEQQIKMRAQRINQTHENFYLLTETNCTQIFKDIIIVDSIQTLTTPLIESAAGSVSQIRECAAAFQIFAKQTNTPVFLIGHITKDGSIAGPKILEHMVDVVLQFEGDRHYAYRILRTIKNRFGSTSEIGIYEMLANGLRMVSNPSEILISQKDGILSGSSIAAMLEGARPLLIEVQALVTNSFYGTPQRTTTGFDLRRLQLLLAVLEKRGGFAFGTKDVFLNIAGGLKVEDSSIDLAVIMALLSSYEDVPVPNNICFTGEVGLNGEIRAVSRIEQRIAEAAKLGFDAIVLSKYNAKIITENKTINSIKLGTVEELYNQFFGK